MYSKFRCVLVMALALALVGTFAVAAGKHPSTIDPGLSLPVSGQKDLVSALGKLYTQEQLQAGAYVGAEYCLSCHEPMDEKYGAWRHTLHAFFIRKPMAMYAFQPGKGVLCNMLGNPVMDDFQVGLDFNALTGTPFDTFKPNAPILSYEAATDSYFITVGTVKCLVAATLGGQSPDNGQRFIVRIPTSDGPNGWSAAVYFGAISYNPATKTYSANAATTWYNGTAPRLVAPVALAALTTPWTGTTSFQGQNYMKNCVGCHMTGIRRAFQARNNGEYVVNPWPASLVPEDSPNYPDIDGDGVPDLINIQCEACHGPGSAHILAHGDPALIVTPNPTMMPSGKDRSKACLQCHVQTGSTPNQTWGFTFDETNNKAFQMTNPPDDLALYQKSKAVKWPDGVAYCTARIDSYMTSAHYEGDGFSCSDCHNSHSETSNPAQVRDLISRRETADIPTSVHDNSFCLACHARSFASTRADIKAWKTADPPIPIPEPIRTAIEAHSHHPYGPERSMGLSNCITCHMATNHTFWMARPEDTIAFKDVVTSATVTGNINSCSAACHRTLVRLWTDYTLLPASNNLYGTANEQALAAHLVRYFGPGGEWWDTTPPPATAAHKTVE